MEDLLSSDPALASPGAPAPVSPVGENRSAEQRASTPDSGEACDLTLRIAGMSCAACQAHVERALAAVPGVERATVDLLAHTAHITTATALDPAKLTSAVRGAGYDVVAPSPNSTSGRGAEDANEVAEPGHGSLGLRALLALLAGLLAMLLSMPLMQAPSPGASSREVPLSLPTSTPTTQPAPLTGSTVARSTAVLSSHAARPSSDRVTAILMRLSMPLLPRWLLIAPRQLLRWILFALALGTMLFAAPEIYRAAWRAARHRTTNMNTLVALGTLTAFLASLFTTLSFSIGRPSQNFTDVYYEAVVLILAFLLAGRWLEARARRRATASLRTLARTEAGQVRWIGEGTPPALATEPNLLLNQAETMLPLDAVAVGDLLRVLPGDRLPLDGIVLAGRSSVEESMLTGEPLPVTRGPGDKVFAGTLNLDGPLLLRATALGTDSMQAQMARLLERARATRAPMQRLADRVSAVFVPAVLGLAALTFAVWAVVDNTGPHALGYGRALSFAVAVLVVACPCAMGLAVPAAVAVSLGAAARAGILIKGGEALERLAGVDTIALDKTGTLTEGRPRIANIEIAPGAHFPQPALLSWAAAVEGSATHPLAHAVLAFAAEKLPPSTATPPATDARVLPGTGAEATVEGHRVAIGSAALLQEASLPVPQVPSSLGHATPMYLLVDGRHEATLFATDTLRPSAKTALDTLRRLRLTPTLLTGDTPEAAAALASEAGLLPTSVRARLLPSDKLTAIGALQAQGHHVAMVGDGLNDAAALAQADAGIAMASGTDLAREAGHVLLMQHDLRLVPAAVALARRTRRLMRQNLGWALLYNVLGIPLAAGVLLPSLGITLSPALASAAMALSSVSVLLNSLRLARPVRL